MTVKEHRKTISEERLEAYLQDRGLDDFEYEPKIDGTEKTPDYRIPVDSSSVFTEVKEFAPEEWPKGVGSFDPYPPIRRKITDAVKQLHALKGQPCVLMLSNPYGALVPLNKTTIFGAMLGNVGITMPYDPAIQGFDSNRASQAFFAGGKMIRYVAGRPFEQRNTTISAICALEYLREGSRRLGIHIAQWERASGERRSLERVFEMALAAEGTDADGAIRHLRLVVCENPYAVAPLPQAFGIGPFDERWGFRDGDLTRMFVGADLAALEKDEQAAGVRR